MLTNKELNILYGLKDFFEYKYKVDIKVNLFPTYKYFWLGYAGCKSEWYPLRHSEVTIELYLQNNTKLNALGKKRSNWNYVILHEFGHLHHFFNADVDELLYLDKNIDYKENYADQWALDLLPFV